MISAILITIFTISLVFLDSLFFSLGGFSFYFLFSLNAFDKVKSIVGILVLIISGFALDSILHAQIGLHLLIVGLLLLLFTFVGKVIPVEGKISRYVVIFVIFLFAYFVRHILISFLGDGVFPILSSNIIVSFFVNSLISALLTFVLDLGFSAVGDSKGFEKIRLR